MRAMGQITIRAARPGDARGIARLDVETWRTTYAGMLSTSYLVGLSERRRELGWRGVILREPREGRHFRLRQLRTQSRRSLLLRRGVHTLRRPGLAERGYRAAPVDRTVPASGRGRPPVCDRLGAARQPVALLL